MQDFHRLDVWTFSHSLTLNVYRATSAFPPDERFGITSQLRRSTASIPANIAEGCGRDSRADFARFLQMALGSASETEYHLLLAKDLKYLEEPEYRELESQVHRVKRMLSGLRASVLKHKPSRDANYDDANEDRKPTSETP